MRAHVLVLAIAVQLAASCNASPTGGGASSASASPTVTVDDPASSDEAYCKLFAARMNECMPLTRERTNEQEAARCLGGRTTARARGQWDDGQRRALVQCLKMPTCDDVDACMSKK